MLTSTQVKVERHWIGKLGMNQDMMSLERASNLISLATGDFREVARKDFRKEPSE